MRKIVAAINMTIDGYCDHTAGIPDEELHQHYTELLNQAGAIIYGRITYRLMESSWPPIAKNPTGNKSMDEFAVAIQNIPKIVFSRTLTDVKWENSKLARRSLEEEVSELRQQSGKDIFVGSPGLIAALTRLNLIDEYQLCVHPVITGSGLQLFKNISNRVSFKLLKTKIFSSGAIILYYVPVKK
ncbi:MAG: dihydrofolate reductase family protein [Methanococcaceae archaeon]